MLAENRVRPTTVVTDSRSVLDADAGVLAIPLWPREDTEAEPRPDDDAGLPASHPAPWIGPGGAEIIDSLGLDLFGLVERERGTGKAGEILSLPVFAEGRGAGSVDGDVDVTRVLLVGLGDGSPAAHRKAGASLARATRGVERVASTVTAASGDADIAAFVEGAVLATFALDAHRSKPLQDTKAPLRTLVLAGSDHGSDVVERGVARAGAAWYARELVHTPPNIKDPAWMAAQARDVGRTTGIDVHVRDEKKLEAEGFGGIVAVGMGSARPPRLVAMRYEPRDADATTPHVVLVGKGITFDSGGLSLKPRASMTTMKTDMSGAAAVLGVMSAVSTLKVPVRVTGLLALAENMPGASAQRPSDVITQYDGTTVEVLNTDAEGRLVLADAIAYAVAELQPDTIVDIATLTGAATVGLGRSAAALYSTDDELATALARAGDASGERMWRMPLVDDYRHALDSPVADLAHIATSKVNGGSIVAALFLERFTGGVSWAHLDIAGTGRADKDAAELVKGGTGYGVRALLTWLETYGADET